jgi:hypothetical protein
MIKHAGIKLMLLACSIIFIPAFSFADLIYSVASSGNISIPLPAVITEATISLSSSGNNSCSVVSIIDSNNNIKYYSAIPNVQSVPNGRSTTVYNFRYSGTGTLNIFCSGNNSVSVDVQADQLYTNALMGLAGIVCAGLFGYAILGNI